MLYIRKRFNKHQNKDHTDRTNPPSAVSKLKFDDKDPVYDVYELPELEEYNANREAVLIKVKEEMVKITNQMQTFLRETEIKWNTKDSTAKQNYDRKLMRKLNQKDFLQMLL